MKQSRSRITLLALMLAFAASLIAGGLTPASADDEAAPVLTVTPGYFAFGPINVGGELGEPGNFILSNEGTVPVELFNAQITGANQTSFIILPNGSSCYDPETADGILVPGESCNIVTIFDPVIEGPNSANLRIDSDSVTSPDLLPLTGTGLAALLPGAEVSPANASFGDLLPGASSDPLVFNLTSTGTGHLRVDGLLTSGDDVGDFEITGNNCLDRSIATGDSCQLRVVFTPSSPGEKSAEFTFLTDAPSTDSTTIEVTGRGSDPDPGILESRVLAAKSLPRMRRSGHQAIPVRCFVTNMDFCRGRVTLKARGRSLGLRHNRLVAIGSQSYTLRSGSRTVRVKLGNRARQQVRRRGRLQVRVITTSRQGNGSVRTADTGRWLRR